MPDPADIDAALPPRVSVVIPTFNRIDRLRRVLEGLAAQSPTGPFEVIVVSDGSTDGTDEYLRGMNTPIPVIALAQENRGPSAARNRGVAAASGEIVLFIDDDVIPEPGLVAAHVDAHDQASRPTVVIGPMMTPDDATLSPWVLWEQHQLYKQYDAMARGDYEPTFRQFYTGNASLPRQSFVDAGGFDTRLRRAEDVELAYRLHANGLQFAFVPSAEGKHHAERSFESWLRTPSEYGRNDVGFIRNGQQWLGPAFAVELGGRNPATRFLARSVAPHRRRAKTIGAALQWMALKPPLPATARRHVLSALYGLTYYGAVAEAVGSPERFAEFAATGRLDEGRPRATFVLEQTLGHVTHSSNLQTLLVDHPLIDVDIVPIEFDVGPPFEWLPGGRNWTVRAGLRTALALRRRHSQRPLEMLFVHTQVPAVLNNRWLRRTRSIVSLDATPVQYDSLGEFYAHRAGSSVAERVKTSLNRRCFESADHLVTWSSWTRDSLVQDYGIDAERVTVIPPGVDIERWARPPDVDRDDGPVRVLFVGGDLERKGGHLLLEAARKLRGDPSVPAFEVHLVTRTAVQHEVGVIVHSAMTPNSAALIGLYHASDVFCLPTLGDCLPMVLSEAGIAGMALISTSVGAIGEIVRDDETGLLIPPGDLNALVRALSRLIGDPALRQRLGDGARRKVRAEFDASVNTDRIVALLLGLQR
jgi:glycosyltransferase involved in cell wall biosynthesis/GT2 family glycosyltransferase